MDPCQGIVLFPSVHFAIKAEKLIRSEGFPAKLIPIPRHLSSDCGVGLRIPWKEKETIGRILAEASVRIEGIYPLEPKAAPGKTLS